MAIPKLFLAQVVAESAMFRLPRIVAYNRLEGSPRTTDFTESLSAEVRDPLWMLTRQWQFGEFRGQDAASPLTARIAYQHSRTGAMTLGTGPAMRFDAELPAEARVERETAPLVVRETAAGEVYSDVACAVRWGKALQRRMGDAGLGAHYGIYVEGFPLRALAGDSEAQVIAAAVAGRMADGVAVWRAVAKGTHAGWLAAQAGLTAGDVAALTPVIEAFAQACAESVGRLYTEPDAADGKPWAPNHLEYQFALSAQTDAATPVLTASQYSEGHLDWYAFDATNGKALMPGMPATPDVEGEQVESFLPAPVRFKGQPEPRFWAMEAARTDFGKIDTSTTGLLHLLLAEFALIYANDWFMLPHPMPFNTLCEIRGIVIDNTFGRHTFLRAAGRGPESAWQRFAMFHLTEAGDRPDAAGNLFYLPPAVGHTLESAPLERVNFVRDEMANMVWAVEAVVPSQTGQGVSGYGPSTTAASAATPWVAPDANVRVGYVAGTTVPDNWIPFLPVHAVGSVSEVRLQRARMAGGLPPRGRLLREPGSPYFIEEEEVPRAGVYVARAWQRTRWLGGRTVIWVGRRKTAGRGEGASQLAFDRVVNLKPKG